VASGTIKAICIGAVAGGLMQVVQSAEAIAGQGLNGDRYSRGEGSFNKGRQGRRQVTLINGSFFPGSGFEYVETRRNIVTLGIELMDLIGKEFRVGEALMRGVKYCDPCLRPSALSGKTTAFKDVFHDRGGLVAEVLESGMIRVDDLVIPPKKNY
jgi:MOSC domain-containing protein